MTIIVYRKNCDIDIQFEDGYISQHKEYRAFTKGNINNPNFDYCKKKDRINETITLTCGATAKIINYKDANNMEVLILETGEIFKNVDYRRFQKGNIKPKYFPSVYEHGYLGERETTDKKGNQTEAYRSWISMMERCYSEEYHKKQPTYKEVTCCEEWLNYSNFAKWYDENFYTCEDETMALDKDILVKGNKIYSPETCIFVPQSINSLFVKNDINRGDTLIGVYYDDSKDYTKKYKVSISKKNKRVYLGRYKTEIEAFNVYKKEKEAYIKEVADEYKNKIPEKLYNALYKYEVEITD